VVPLPLPIDPYLGEVLAAVRRSRALVLTAEPGAGKTTRVAPALSADGPAILLQPRRVAARSIARYIASEQTWTLGDEVGWQVRFERRFGPRTRLLVATEGILTARLQQDPLLSGFRTVILDEFHERSLHADLGLALARQAWLAREDLRLVVMSATLDARAIAAFLDDCPVIEIPGRLHPLEISYAPHEPLAQAVADMLSATTGQVLCFLPGAPEIRRAIGEIDRALGSGDIETVPLHGSLDAEEQDRAIEPARTRRVIVATNIAETSLTVPGVTAVVDTGLQKVVRYDPARAIDSLETERIARDSADQRAGRAGRVAPGAVRRLWDERDRLRPVREAEILRVDLSGLVLDVLAWGGDPDDIQWLEPPPPESLEAAFALLGRLGAVDGRRLTDLGGRLRGLPLHPRLGRILLDARGAREAARVCALLSERHYLPPRSETTTSDLLSALDEWERMPAHVRRAAEEIESLGSRVSPLGSRALARRPTEKEFRKAVLSGYPDRVAKRREPGSARVVLASGHGAVVASESGVRSGEFLVAIDVQAGARGLASEARIRIASRVERDWLSPTGTRTVHRFDAENGSVKAFRQEVYDELVLDERQIEPDDKETAGLLVAAKLEQGLTEAEDRLICRLRFAGFDVNVEDLVRRAVAGARSLGDIDLAGHVPPDRLRQLDRLAPKRIGVPSGRRVPLEYRDDGAVAASVKLQELFGLAETPRVGARAEPVLLELLAPNGRPVQVTRDLRSFWDRGYPEVRKQLRGRYPKHPWPEDPWTARATGRTRGQK